MMLIMANKQLKGVEFNEIQISYFYGLNWRIGVLFLLHTLLTVYAAFFLSTNAWFFVTGLFFYVLFFLFFLLEFCYSRFVIRKRMALYFQRQK
jgi:hypothetical protein